MVGIEDGYPIHIVKALVWLGGEGGGWWHELAITAVVRIHERCRIVRMLWYAAMMFFFKNLASLGLLGGSLACPSFVFSMIFSKS